MESSSGNILFQLALILLLTGVNAFFASAEMAIVSVNKNKIKRLSEEGNAKAKLLEKLIEEPSNFLSTIQIGITLAGFFSSASAATGLSSYLSKFMETVHIPYSSELSMIGVTLVLSYFTLVFGELVPKRIALKKAETIALFSASAIYSISIVARPFIKILSLSTSLILKLTGNTTEDIEEKVSEEELRALIYQSKKDGCIEAEEQQMLEGVFEFNDRMAKEIMTHRKDTFVINIEEPIEEILDKVIKLHYSRIPVYREDIDHIVGVLYVKDLIAEARKVGFENITLEKILHTPYFVPETKKINALFKSFKEKKKHIAILINEYGGFAGIVTMEDLIEEIMGEIHDEYDEEEEGIKKIGKNTFLVKGSEAIYHINHSLGIQLPNGDYDTLNGYLAQQIGDIPEENVDIEMDHIHFKIIKMKSNRIEQVQIQFMDSL